LSTRALAVGEAELARLGLIADRLLAGRPVFPQGTQPHRTRAGRGLEFLELRPWVAGDDPRDVDWRASARSRRLLLRRRRDEAFSSVVVCLDRSSSMSTGGGEKWTLAVQVAAAFAWLALHAGNRVGLVAFSSDVDVVHAPVRGRAGYAQLAARLSAIEPRPGGGVSRLDACVRHLPAGASAAVVSDFLGPDFLRPGLERLASRGRAVQVFQVLSATELDLPDVERALLRDVESGEVRPLRLTPDARESAALRLHGLSEQLQSYCRSRGIALTACHSGTSWRDALLAHLRAVVALRA